MKIVLAGDGHSGIHERACAAALRALGHDVVECLWSLHFRRTLGIGTRDFRSFSARLQNHLIAGGIVRRFNEQLQSLCAREKPDFLLVYRGTHVLPETLRAIARQGIPLVSLNNDDPFSPEARAAHWRHFRAALPLYDVHFVYRHRNLEDFARHGATRVHLLRSWFIASRNHPIALTREQRDAWGHDVVFIGHYEDDGRREVLEALIEAGIDVAIHGPEWELPFRRSAVLRRTGTPRYLGDAEYNIALNASKIALSFLSRLNRDTYTRRSFEIPAAGTFQLSERTDDLETLFAADREIVFFASPQEAVERATHYLADDRRREEIARNGYERVHRDGHDVVSRMRELLAGIALHLYSRRFSV